MKEINYFERTQMGKAPVISKKGIFGSFGESTPFVWHGKLKWLHTRNERVGDSFVFHSHFVIRDDETGEASQPMCPGYHFYSCYEENGVLYVFATNQHGEEKIWGGDSVIMMWSSDLENWQEKKIICRPGWVYFNTSVCKGRNGKYIMSIEAGEPRDKVGVIFTIFFFESDDLFNWKPMDDEIRYNDKRYTACPAIRYLTSDDYYYMVSLEELPLRRYAPYIYRTHDFVTWEIGIHNPVLWISEEDRNLAPGAEKNLKPDRAKAYSTYVNINNCDLDFCEFEGKTHIGYLTGNQMNSGFFCEAEYDGSLERFLQTFFE